MSDTNNNSNRNTSSNEGATKYKPRPYFNVANLAEQDTDEQFDHKQNPNRIYGQSPADSDTRMDMGDATSTDNTDYKKRWIDLKKHYDTEVSDLRRQLQEKEATESFTPPKTAEEMESFRKQHPEFYDVMLSVAYSQMSQYGETAGSRLRQLEEKLAQSEQERAFSEIEKAHPDYMTIVNDAKFLEWLDVQDDSIQSWVKTNSNNARQFIRAIDLYKLDAGITKKIPKRSDTNNRDSSKETNRRFDYSAAADVSVSGSSAQVGDTNKRVWSREEITRMTPQEFSKYEVELDEAMLEGRVR